MRQIQDGMTVSFLRPLRHLLPALLLALPFNDAMANSASPHPYTVTQPNGTDVILYIKGNEDFSWEHDIHGFTVIKDRGWYVFAKWDAATDRLVSSGLRAGIDEPGPRGLVPGILPSAAARSKRRPANLAPGQGGAAGSSAIPDTGPPATGTLRNLVVLIRWADHLGRSTPSQGDIAVLMNNSGPHASLAPTGSLRDFYLENSYGRLSLESTVAYWITVPNTERYYADGNNGLTTRIHGALTYALQVLDADPDFRFADFDLNGDGKIDAITFLHSGYGAEWGGNDCTGTHYRDRIWSHKWKLSNAGWSGWQSSDGVTVSDYHISPALWGTCGNTIGRIGVIAHETGHFLGLPDLYDTDGSGSGIGSYGLMANSWGFDGSQYYPPHASPWSKFRLGWVTPTVIDTVGNYAIPEVESNPAIYRINNRYAAGEYLLIENRQPRGFDAAMPQGGLAIWHIDETADYDTEGYPGQSGWPGNGNHYRVALVQADGAFQLEHGTNRGDSWDVWHAAGVADLGPSLDVEAGPFPNTDGYQGGVVIQTGTRIFNISASGPNMSFSLSTDADPATTPSPPTDLTATPVSHSEIRLYWQDNSNTENGFLIEQSTDSVTFLQIETVSADMTTYISSGLTPDRTYWYRVRAYNGVGDSSYSNTASTSTFPPPPPPTAPSHLVATTVSDVSVDLSWTDNSLDEWGFRIRRSLDQSSWVDVATVPPDTSLFRDSGLEAATTYYYRVFAYTTDESGSNIALATTDPVPVVTFAFPDLDILVSGTVTGGSQETLYADGVAQVLTEEESGGKPSNRRSYAELQWRFGGVRAGLAVTLMVRAWAPANPEQDDFEFQVSTDGSNWSPTLLTVRNGTTPGSVHTGSLDNRSKGTVYVRIVDSDDTPGNRNLDSVYIDQIYIRTDLDTTDYRPDAPSHLAATPSAPNAVELNWVDNSDNELGFEIRRSSDGVVFSTVGGVTKDTTHYVDAAALQNTTYTYKVAAYTLSFESESGAAVVTTPDGLTLSATGYRKKGKYLVDLNWTGGASASVVQIKRSLDGSGFSLIATVENSNGGVYTDDTGLKSGHTLIYQVCTPDGAVCSAFVSHVF